MFDAQPDRRSVITCHPPERVRDYLHRGWWQPETLLDMFGQWVERRPDAVALTDPANLADLTGAEPRALTWSQLAEQIENTAAALLAHNIRQGDVVAVLLPNSVDLVVTYLALWRLGAVATPMPVSYRRHEISTIIAASDATAVITVAKLNDRHPVREMLTLAADSADLHTVFTFAAAAVAESVSVTVAGSKSVAESEPVAESRAKSESEPRARAKPMAESELVALAEAEPEPVAKSDLVPMPVAKSRAASEAVAEFVPVAESRSEPEQYVPGAVALRGPAHWRDRLREYLANLHVTINDRVTICWTSGTEAAPKGVPRCHADWLAVGWGVQDGLETTEESVILNLFPMVNMAGFAASFLPWLLGGGHLVQHHPLDLPVFLRQIQDHRATHTSMPPALLTMLLQRAELRAATDLSSLQRVGSGGAPLPPGVVREWQDGFGIEVLNFFGSNEGVCLLGAPTDIPDPTTRAQYLPNYASPSRTWATRVASETAVRLVDTHTGKVITEVGGQGELRLQGPTVFAGYLSGTATASPFDEHGFLCSGDVFELCGDDGSYLKFVDRVKEIIIRGGMNIAPAEIEGLLIDHPAVADVAIIGYPDEVMGEKCCAIVVPAPGAVVTLQALTDHLRTADIASFKLPERLELATELPRNPVGKLMRRELRTHLLVTDSAR